MEKNDSQLIKETLKGVLSSFEVLVRRYEKPIYVHSLRILKKSAAAEDATQETFLRAFEKLKSFDTNKPLKPWIYQIATNYCFDHIRKNARYVRLENDVQLEETSLIDKIAKREEIEKLKSALSKLPKIYFEPVWGYYFLDLDYSKLAKSLDIPVNTLRTRLRRGKANLYKKMTYEN